MSKLTDPLTKGQKDVNTKLAAIAMGPRTEAGLIAGVVLQLTYAVLAGAKAITQAIEGEPVIMTTTQERKN